MMVNAIGAENTLRDRMAKYKNALSKQGVFSYELLPNAICN
jgi:hypothetical protein